jgi:hypothetical protein
MAKNSQHVVPNPDGGWNIRKSGAVKASKHFDKKQDAVIWAREISQNQHSELVIHKADGTIQAKDSYGRIV